VYFFILISNDTNESLYKFIAKESETKLCAVYLDVVNNRLDGFSLRPIFCKGSWSWESEFTTGSRAARLALTQLTFIRPFFSF
jgi:hypothetical protein